MINHISLGVSNIDRSKEFYDAIFKPLGFEAVWSVATGVGYGLTGKGDRFCIKLVNDQSAAIAAGSGSHFAFEAASHTAVHQFYDAALSHGGRCNGRPGLRPQYGKTYYAAFVIDPDGHRLEAVYQ